MIEEQHIEAEQPPQPSQASDEPGPSITEEEALAAWHHVRVAWDKWIVVARYIERGRTLATERAAAARGRVFSREMEAALGSSFYTDAYLKLSENGTTVYLTKILANFDAVTSWRDALPEGERVDHPYSVWKGFEASLSDIERAIEERAMGARRDDADNRTGAGRTPFDDLERPEDFQEQEGHRRRRRAQDDQRTTNQALTERLTEILHQLEMAGFSGNPEEDAMQKWLNVLRQFANDKRLAADYCRTYCRKLGEIVDRECP